MSPEVGKKAESPAVERKRVSPEIRRKKASADLPRKKPSPDPQKEGRRKNAQSVQIDETTPKETKSPHRSSRALKHLSSREGQNEQGQKQDENFSANPKQNQLFNAKYRKLWEEKEGVEEKLKAQGQELNQIKQDLASALEDRKADARIHKRKEKEFLIEIERLNSAVKHAELT